MSSIKQRSSLKKSRKNGIRSNGIRSNGIRSNGSSGQKKSRKNGSSSNGSRTNRSSGLKKSRKNGSSLKKRSIKRGSKKNKVINEIIITKFPVIPNSFFYKLKLKQLEFLEKIPNNNYNVDYLKNLAKESKVKINGEILLTRFEMALKDLKEDSIKLIIEKYISTVIKKSMERQSKKFKVITGGSPNNLAIDNFFSEDENTNTETPNGEIPETQKNNRPKDSVDRFIEIMESTKYQKAFGYFIILALIMITSSTVGKKIYDVRNKDFIDNVDPDTLINSFTEIVVTLLYLIGYITAGGAVVKVLTSRGETIEIKTERSNLAALTGHHPLTGHNPYPENFYQPGYPINTQGYSYPPIQYPQRY